jgi:hypothetical protein
VLLAPALSKLRAFLSYPTFILKNGKGAPFILRVKELFVVYALFVVPLIQRLLTVVEAI